MDQTNHILEYWSKIQAGEIVACKRLKQQYAKLVDELHNPRDPWVFDLAKANAPIEFIERFCRHSKGKWVGQPVKLELFQKAKFQAIFGFVHKETGFRRCREVLTVEARKNGKSTEMAGLGLYMLVGDGEGGPEIVSLATRRRNPRSTCLLSAPALTPSNGIDPRSIERRPARTALSGCHTRRPDLRLPFQFYPAPAPALGVPRI
jgi:hypothetical protein